MLVVNGRRQTDDGGGKPTWLNGNSPRQRAELAGAAAGALLKLRAAGVDAEDTQTGIEPRVHTGEAAFGPLWEAVMARRPVTFAYRAAGRSGVQQRRLEPWGVVNRHGRWYVAGHDMDRDAVRVFRLSRIEGAVSFGGPPGSVVVPAGTDVRELVRDWDSSPPAYRTATLRVRTGAGHGLRRQATAERPDGDGWDEYVDTDGSVVKVTISRLRRKLGDPPVIETVPHGGYRIDR